jgi:hypothetical protein
MHPIYLLTSPLPPDLSTQASEADDITEFNPRTKRGKMIIAAARKLVELTHK